MKNQQQPPIFEIRPVWADNIDAEFALINSAFERHPFIAIDTEFPGTIHTSPKPYYQHSCNETYALLKANIDDLHLIQLGLTLFDADGNLPDLGTQGAQRFAWEFNFCDFDLQHDRFVPDSIKLLRSSGINLEKNRQCGVHTARFGELLADSPVFYSPVSSWVTFHGAYDFGFLLKTVTMGGRLPDSLDDFMHTLRMLFGGRIFDLKRMMLWCNGLFGGLENLARLLSVERATGRCHQAGSDSLLIALAFHRMIRRFFPDDQAKSHQGFLYGL